MEEEKESVENIESIELEKSKEKGGDRKEIKRLRNRKAEM